MPTQNGHSKNAAGAASVGGGGGVQARGGGAGGNHGGGRALNQPTNHHNRDSKHSGSGDTTLYTYSKTQGSADRKMFGQYAKLPPIRKPSNNDGKRLSLTTRDYSEGKINALYEQYRDPEEDCMLAEGIEKFCNDLAVRPEEFRVLVLAWKFNAETMCRFTHAEFVNGCKTLKVDSIKGIQAKFPEMLLEVLNNKVAFKELYRWTYKFGLDADTGQRTLPVDMAIGLWSLVFSQKEPSILKRWLAFLDRHPSIRGIPKDTWDMFLNFYEAVGDDLSSYDDTEAWPSLFDDFVEYDNDRENQNVETDKEEETGERV